MVFVHQLFYRKLEMSKTLKLGIIGCGGHSQHHAEACAGIFDVYSAWDPDPSQMSLIPQASRRGSLEELLTDSVLDAVLIGSPDEFHLEQIERALAHGKHVFCEKPLLVPGQAIERLERVFAFAEEKGLRLTSCHPRRFDRPALWFKGLDPGSYNLGKPIAFYFDFSYHAPTNSWKHSRSLLLDHLNHEVDLMNFFFGIKGFAATKLRDGFDCYEVVGIRDDGISFHFHGTRRLNASTYPEWCRIRFEQGEVELDMMNGVSRIISHETKETRTFNSLAIDYDGRLKRAMIDFRNSIWVPGSEPYLNRSEMLMNTECGIVLQEAGLQKIGVRP